MKKIICSIVYLLLLIALCPLANAAENANVVFDSTTEIIVSVASSRDTAYALVFSDGESKLTLMQWKAGMAGAKALPVEGLTRNGYNELGNPAVVTDVSLLFSGDDELYAYNEYNKSVRKLVDAQGNLTSTTILYFLEEEETFEEENIESLFVQDRRLYVIKSSDSSELMISTYNVQTGELLGQRKDKSLEGVYPYKDGKLLALRFERLMDEATGNGFPMSF